MALFRYVMTVAAGASLIACSPSPGSGKAQEDAPAEAARSIEGTYVVTFANGEKPLINIAGHEPTLTITGDRIHLQSQCIYDDWSYRLDGEAIRTGEWDYKGDRAMCARSFAIGELAIIKAIDAAETVRFVPHGLWLSGEGGTIQMRFVPSAEEVAARAVDLTGEWRVAGIDGKPLDASYGIALSADFYSIWWEPGCAGQGVSYTITGSAFDAPPPQKPGMVCDIGFPPELGQIWSALSAAGTIERTPENGVLISGDGRSVLLFSQ